MIDNNEFDETAFGRLRKLGGDDFLAKMIDLFLENTPQRMETIRAGEKDGNLEQIRQAAHSLKSSAGNLGARRLQELSERVEHLAVEQKGDLLTPLLRELDGVFARALLRLEDAKRGAS